MAEKPTYEQLEKRCQVLQEKLDQHKQAEAALLDSEKRYRDLFDNINDLIMIHDTDGSLLDVNPAVSKLSGYSPEELIGRPISDFIIPEFQRLFKDEYLKEINNTGHSEGIAIFQAKDGREYYVEYRNTLVQPPRSDRYISGLGRDITDRILAERARRESEEHYRTVFQTTGTATIIVESDETISLANSTFEDLSGFSKEEIEGKKGWTEFVNKDDLEPIREFHRACKDDPGAGPANFEFEFVDRYGNLNNILVIIAMIPGTEKSVVSLLNITDRKRAEEALRRSHAQLEFRVQQRTAELAEANMQLTREIEERRKAEKEVRKLSGLLPICSSCKKIRDDTGYWNELEDYIQKHSEAEFSHSVCPDCAQKLYPGLKIYD